MEIKVQSRPSRRETGEVLVWGHYEGSPLSAELKRLDHTINGRIEEAFDSKVFSGKFLTTTLLQTNNKATPRVLLLGLGPLREMTLDKTRQAMGKAATFLRDAGVTHLFVPLSGMKFSRASLPSIAQVLVEGVVLALYRFDRYKTDRKENAKEIKELCLGLARGGNKASVTRAVLHGQWIAEAVNATRDLCNLPSNVLTPSRLAEEAKMLGERYPIRVSVLERADAEDIGMGAFLGVARGTTEPPKFIVLEYRGARGRPVALIGKSVTFDSGGISIKPAENMEQMKYDMSGGATVLGAMKVAAQMKLPLHIVGVLPATDNMPSGHAMHPGDIVNTLSGKTVEVINTDAEGRLCLADAITYAMRYKPHTIIDLATLTGACVVALGHHAMALFGNHPPLIERIKRASEETGERVWPMPLWEEYFDQIKSDVADLKNTGGRPGGSITAALFLKQFVGETPWVHLDIAGVAWNGEKQRPYTPKGSTGAGVRLLIQYLIEQGRGR